MAGSKTQRKAEEPILASLAVEPAPVDGAAVEQVPGKPTNAIAHADGKSVVVEPVAVATVVVEPIIVRQGSVLAEVVAPVAGLIAAWIAAGSVGLLGHPLCHALSWLAMGTIVVAAWPDWRRPVPISWPSHQPLHQPSQRNSRQAVLWTAAIWIAGIVAALAMTSSSLAVVNVMAPAVLLGAVAAVRPDAGRALRIAALAVAVFGVYRLANTSIPWLWLLTDRFGGALGRAAAGISGTPLQVGATFGGVDFLVLMTTVYTLCLLDRPAPRWRYAAWGAAGIVVAQLFYLVVLSKAPGAVDYLTAKPAESEWLRRWVAELAAWKQLLPWNLPALAAIGQGVVAAAMFYCLRGKGNPIRQQPGRVAGAANWNTSIGLAVAAAAMAALIPIITLLSPYRATLDGKKVVAFEHGYLNWLKPVHGDYGQRSGGMYGMFGQFVESLGGTFTRSPELTEEDLRDADLLVLFYPQRTAKNALKDDQLLRIQQYVQRGGTLLLFTDHTGHEPSDTDPFTLHDNRANDLLEPTAIRAGFDSANFAVGGWLHSYEALGHPATTGISDERNLFGVVIGASLAVDWPARPILIGRWGYSDVGQEGNGGYSGFLGNERYDPGEKLGDMILAAEQPWGKGRVLAFGDTSSVINGIVIGSHPFVSRLLAYLANANDVPSPQSPLRQVAGAVLAILVAVLLLAFRPTAGRAVAVAAALSVSLAICVAVTASCTDIIPSGAPHQENAQPADPSATPTSPATPPAPAAPNNLAYLDACHLGAYSEEGLRPDGIFGLQYTLARNGYLVLSLYDPSYERLHEAGLFISIGPQRPFTASERETIHRFVEEGGIFILMAGYDRSAGSRELLDEFGFTVGAIPPWLPEGTEPGPLGYYKWPYFPGYEYDQFTNRLTMLRMKPPPLHWDYHAYVRFRAAWPVTCDNPTAKIVARGIVDRPFDPGVASFRAAGTLTMPVIVVRTVGKGKIVVIGDTEFATNKNLENEDGTPIEGLRENADFWRWFLADLRGLPPWIPPNPQPPATPMPAVPAPIAPPPAASPPVAASPASRLPAELPADPAQFSLPDIGPAAKQESGKEPAEKKQPTQPDNKKADSEKTGGEKSSGGKP